MPFCLLDFVYMEICNEKCQLISKEIRKKRLQLKDMKSFICLFVLYLLDCVMILMYITRSVKYTVDH